MKVKGGRAIYGASLGILMLEARFPRIPGDVGNAASFDFPVHYRVVKNASPERVVMQGARGLLDAFVNQALELKAVGVDGITTNCGFLSIYQQEIANAVGLPVATSSLMQHGMIARLLPPGRRVGIITVSKSTLSERHLESASVPRDAPVVGTDSGCEFSRVILGNEMELDVGLARKDLLDAATELTRTYDNIGAILLECTNMCPFSADIAQATGLPVFDMVGFIDWFQASLRPRLYGLDIR